jgi:hypothetical protein
MVTRTASKINTVDAQEWLESLQQVGQGWYRQVALAVRAGAHTALNMNRREFAQSIGQQLIDPKQAIIELADELKLRGKPNIQAIAEVLGVGHDRVSLVLAEAGLIKVEEGSYRQRQLAEGQIKPKSASGTDSSADDQGKSASGADLAAEVATLQEQIEAVKANAKGDRVKHRDEVADLKEQIAEYKRKATNALRDARKKAQDEMSEQERERARKEAEASITEQTEEMLSAFTPMLVRHVVGDLADAVEDLQTLVREARGGVTKAQFGEIERAHASFAEELNIARMSQRV